MTKKVKKSQNQQKGKSKRKAKSSAINGLKGGRPVLFKTVRELQEKIDEYFDSCWIDKVVEVTDKEGNVTATNSRYQNQPYTMMGLALTLNMSRETLCQYSKKDRFSDAIKKARRKVEMNVEEYLLAGKNAGGPIFWLKNNAETPYRDKHEVEQYGPNGQPLEGNTVNINITPMELAVKIAYALRHRDDKQDLKQTEVTAGENETQRD